MKLPLTLSLALLAVGTAGAQAPPGIRACWDQARYSQKSADEGLAAVQAAGLNAVYLLVFASDVMYRTDLAPMNSRVAQGFDPLGYFVEQAHQRGIKVHAWFVNGEASARVGALKDHPDWRMKLPSGADKPLTWFDLKRPEVRQYQVDLVLDCMRRYPIDGVHFDYIRHGDDMGCFCPQCVAEFEKETAFSARDARLPTLPVTQARWHANCANEATTAQVVARFDNGKPGVLINRLGEGECLLLNWSALQANYAYGDTILKRAFAAYGAANGVYLLEPSASKQGYRRAERLAVEQRLSDLGVRATTIDEAGLSKVPASSVVTMWDTYYMSQETAETLRDWVKGGGHAIITDCPTPSMKYEALQEMLGAKGSGYWTGPGTLVPEATHPFLPVGDASAAERQERACLAWRAFHARGVTDLVAETHKAIKAANPNVAFSAAVFWNHPARIGVLQEWPEWLKQGIVDYVIPMWYVTRKEDIELGIATYKEIDPEWSRIVPGLSLYHIVDGKETARPVAMVLPQLEQVKQAGAKGFVFFQAKFLDDQLVPALAAFKMTP